MRNLPFIVNWKLNFNLPTLHWVWATDPQPDWWQRQDHQNNCKCREHPEVGRHCEVFSIWPAVATLRTDQFDEIRTENGSHQGGRQIKCRYDCKYLHRSRISMRLYCQSWNGISTLVGQGSQFRQKPPVIVNCIRGDPCSFFIAICKNAEQLNIRAC
jgi:hypothetical protein